MRKATNQKNNEYKGLTTIMLDSLTEANNLLLASSFYQSDVKLATDSSKAAVLYRQIVASNPYVSERMRQYGASDSSRNALNRCLRAIKYGDPEENAKIAKLADTLKDLALDIEPSLKLDPTWRRNEEGPVADAGLIAAGEDRPCFAKHSDAPPVKPGAGDGAYRIVINTDCCWYQDPIVQSAAVASLVLVLQKTAPCEVWVQQGWLKNGSPKSGVTLFPVHRGGALTPNNLFFWIGHPEKDCSYSFMLNQLLGREGAGVSLEVEIPCDLYLYNVWMENIDLSNKDQVAKWVAMTSRKMLFEEENPDNFGQ
jgi:hypothetical protein